MSLASTFQQILSTSSALIPIEPAIVFEQFVVSCSRRTFCFETTGCSDPLALLLSSLLVLLFLSLWQGPNNRGAVPAPWGERPHGSLSRPKGRKVGSSATSCFGRAFLPRVFDLFGSSSTGFARSPVTPNRTALKPSFAPFPDSCPLPKSACRTK